MPHGGSPLPFPRGRRSARAPKNAPSSLHDCDRCDDNMAAARDSACSGRTRARLPHPHPPTPSILPADKPRVWTRSRTRATHARPAHSHHVKHFGCTSLHFN
ncbi:hypothetical protein JYU34_014333 [Plutella xylostella]|uniref:Uncharacterized protein n=1 Tax=Plutella xylostella TaxID=51655 RepID=A0ABQ7Q833_PLUXY|nr:hypothetical protein JYU34_014333 [Plutella xylostella]